VDEKGREPALDIEDFDRPKTSIAKRLTSYSLMSIMLAVAAFMYINLVYFFIQLGSQEIGNTLLYFIVLLLFWNIVLTIVMIFGFSTAIHNIKMFFLRKSGEGYILLLDRDRGIKRFVGKINKERLKIQRKLYFTNRRMVRLWENRIPTYIYEAGFVEPSSIGLEQKDTPIDSDEYQTTVELAELAGRIGSKKKTDYVIWLVVGCLIIGLATAYLAYQTGSKVDVGNQYLAMIADKLKNITIMR